MTDTFDPAPPTAPTPRPPSVAALRDHCLYLEKERQAVEAALARAESEAQAAFDRRDGAAVAHAFAERSALDARLQEIAADHARTRDALLAALQPALDAWQQKAQETVGRWASDQRHWLGQVDAHLDGLAQAVAMLTRLRLARQEQRNALLSELQAIVATVHPYGARWPDVAWDVPPLDVRSLLLRLADLQRQLEQAAAR
jgi:hypothetical protein